MVGRKLDGHGRCPEGIKSMRMVPELCGAIQGGGMKAFLKIDDINYRDTMAHLLPRDSIREQAAFFFARAEKSRDQIVLAVVETAKLGPGDFTVQEDDYIEMANETRAGLIKRAHVLDASLVELHSHVGPWPAGFSYADRMGLKETVPHMWWRLKKRPYLAIVIAKSGFDALLWLDGPKVPRALDGVMTGTQVLQPTNLSLGGWG